MLAREYKPDFAHFLSQDRFESAIADDLLQADPLTQNRYAFAGGNPVNNVEFDGHSPLGPRPRQPSGGSSHHGSSHHSGGGRSRGGGVNVGVFVQRGVAQATTAPSGAARPTPAWAPPAVAPLVARGAAIARGIGQAFPALHANARELGHWWMHRCDAGCSDPIREFFGSLALRSLYSNTPGLNDSLSADSIAEQATFLIPEIRVGKLVPKAAGLLGKLFSRGSAAKGASEAERGGLNLFKWNHHTSTTGSGWREGDRMLAVPWKGTPKATWKENASRLRREMRSGDPIYETYADEVGNLIPTKGFLNAERNLLLNRGWQYSPRTRAWTPGP
jgi:hypothetical protein